MADANAKLLSAAETGDLPGLQSALAAGADVDTKPPVAYGPYDPKGISVTGGKSALLLAVEGNHADIVAALLAAGADPNLTSDNTHFTSGETPLHAAARAGNGPLIEILLKSGAKPNTKQLRRPNIPGKTPLQLATEKGHTHLLPLLAAGPVKNKTALTDALYEAADTGREDILRTLLQQGADLNAPAGPNKVTPLLIACFNGFLNIVQVLLDAGANPKVPSRHGWTPLTITVHGAGMAPETDRGVGSPRQHCKLLRFLLERGGDVNEMRDGNTLLDDAEGGEIYSPRMKQIFRILKEAGGRFASELDLAEPAEEPPPPDFSKALKKPAFLAALKDFTARFGKPDLRFLDEVPGIPVFKTDLKTANRIVAKEQHLLVKQSIYLCRTGEFQSGRAAHLAIFPTANKYDVLAALQTGGMFEGAAAAIRRLKEIEKSDPFVLTFMSEDTVEGEFLARPKSSRRLASRLHELCPDIVDQGIGEVALLAKQLQKSRRLFLWWD